MRLAPQSLSPLKFSFGRFVRMSKTQPEALKPAEKLVKRIAKSGQSENGRKHDGAENGKRNGAVDAPRKATPKSSGPRTIGPVPDLERHLPSDWWRSLFNSVYLKTDGDVVENYNNTAQEAD